MILSSVVVVAFQTSAIRNEIIKDAEVMGVIAGEAVVGTLASIARVMALLTYGVLLFFVIS